MMKRMLAIFTAALMTTAAAPALAQSGSDAGTSGGSNSGANSMSNGASGGTTNTDQMKTQPDSGGQMGTSGQMGATGEMGASGSMMSMADVTSKLETMTEVSTVEIVNTADMANTDHSTGDAMPPMDTTPEEQAALQQAIQGNPAISEKLEAQAVEPSEIVAANVDANNKVTVYVK